MVSLLSLFSDLFYQIELHLQRTFPICVCRGSPLSVVGAQLAAAPQPQGRIPAAGIAPNLLRFCWQSWCWEVLPQPGFVCRKKSLFGWDVVLKYPF